MKHELTVHKEWLSPRILIVVALIAGIIFSLIALFTTTDPRSRATSINPSPSPFLESKPAQTTMQLPYLRLFTAKKSYRFGEKVPVDVYLHTGGIQIVETTLAIRFDNDVLQFDQNDVALANVFKSEQTTHDEKDKILVSLFVTPQIGHTPVITPVETKIATLMFTVKIVEPVATEINLEFEDGRSSQTNAIQFSKEREITNVLKNVEGVSFEIIP